MTNPMRINALRIVSRMSFDCRIGVICIAHTAYSLLKENDCHPQPIGVKTAPALR